VSATPAMRRSRPSCRLPGGKARAMSMRDAVAGAGAVGYSVGRRTRSHMPRTRSKLACPGSPWAHDLSGRGSGPVGARGEGGQGV
jgi:hypothetical protein